MNAIAFQDHELISRKVKIGNEWQTRTFPVVGGRLRIVHESNQSLSIQTEIIRLETDSVVVKASVQTEKGSFNGTGTAATQRDARLADALVELAETRAIARALRFGGIGVEFTGAEEVSHVPNGEAETEPPPNRGYLHKDGNGKGNGKGTAKSPTNGLATQAQVRALHALSRKAQYHEDDITNLIAPFEVSRFEDLPKEAASQLIGYMQQEVAQ